MKIAFICILFRSGRVSSLDMRGSDFESSTYFILHPVSSIQHPPKFQKSTQSLASAVKGAIELRVRVTELIIAFSIKTILLYINLTPGRNFLDEIWYLFLYFQSLYQLFDFYIFYLFVYTLDFCILSLFVSSLVYLFCSFVPLISIFNIQIFYFCHINLSIQKNDTSDESVD